MKSVSDGGTANYVTYATSETNGITTVTWTIYNVEPLTAGTVSFQAMVNENAKTTEDGETVATVENQATVVIDDGTGTENTYTTNIVVNPIDPDTPVDPEKTVSTSSAAGVNGANVNVGNQITYVISYYNHTNEEADVTIEDELDEGVAYVDATNGGTYDEATHTVTWTIEDVDPYTVGTVELTVEVTKDALTEEYTVENDADVTIGTENTVTTKVVTNKVNDEPEDPEKELTSVIYADADTTAAYDNGNLYVHVGDTVTYAITYYNNLNAAADVTIVDVLDEGVDFVSLTDENGDERTDVYNESGHFVTYTVKDVKALQPGTVYLTVTVNEDAKSSSNNYVTDGTELTYTTIASIANQASVTVGNQVASYTNVVEDPLEEDEQEDPTKTETTINGTAAGEGVDATVNGEDVVEYDEVAVNDSIVYTIEYYNYHNTAATITITDKLDEGVTYAHSSATNGEYDADTHTITWVIENVGPLSGGTVSFRVTVDEDAKNIETGETTATVDNDATVVIDDGTTENEFDTNIVVNPIKPDEPEDPEKVVSEDSEAGAENANVSLGDKITYTISYYNHTNSVANVIIKDELDDGVDFFSATDSGKYDDTTHTVTWTIENVAPYTDGSVDLTVEVNENASTETNGYTVENTATVKVGNEDEQTTEPVENPVNDEPEAPTKTLKTVTYAEEGTTAASDDNNNLYVHVGDTVTYTIDYYNNLNEVATVTIVDVLDEGVTFQSATGVEKDDATEDDTIIYELTEDEDGIVTVTWTVANVEALQPGTVELTVTVNENAKASENTYDAQGGYELIYDTTASIANQASTEVVSATVTNQGTYYSSVVENPLEDEDPVDPVKTAETVEEEDVEPIVSEDGNTVTYDTVGVGETITYTISYYNHHNTAATITIVDPLDEGLTVDETSITDDGVYDADAHTITWVIEDVEPLSGGTVSFQAMVNENAKTIETATETVATVENGATETNSEDAETGHEYKTNIVVHPIDPEEPSEPQKFVSTSSEAGVSGDNVSVGDQITYVITYYNHTNTTADVTVVDTLMDGVTFVSATNDGAYDSDTHTVTWTIADVAPYSGGTVNLTIEVGDEALTATQVENDAAVTIGDNEYTTNLVVNPVDDEPQDPVKSVDVGDGETISVGDQLTYTITYYNHLGTAADVTITDKLDSDVTYVSSSNGGVYDSDTHTVTWTIEDVDAYTEDSVTLTVKVKSGATGTIKNTANVQIADSETQETVSDDDTNEVENPISTTTTSKSSSPKTGDSFQLTLWVLLLAGSAAGLLALYFRRRNSDDAE